LMSDGTFGVLTDTYNFEMHPWTQQPGRNYLGDHREYQRKPQSIYAWHPLSNNFYNTVPVP